MDTKPPESDKIMSNSFVANNWIIGLLFCENCLYFPKNVASTPRAYCTCGFTLTIVSKSN